MTIIDASSGYHNLMLDKKIIIPNCLCMSIWQVQMHQTFIWRGASR